MVIDVLPSGAALADSARADRLFPELERAENPASRASSSGGDDRVRSGPQDGMPAASLNDTPETASMSVAEREFVFTGSERARDASRRRPWFGEAATRNRRSRASVLARSCRRCALLRHAEVDRGSSRIEVWSTVHAATPRAARRNLISRQQGYGRPHRDSATDSRDSRACFALALDPDFEALATAVASRWPANFPSGRHSDSGQMAGRRALQGMDTLISALPRLLPSGPICSGGRRGRRRQAWLEQLAEGCGVRRQCIFSASSVIRACGLLFGL